MKYDRQITISSAAGRRATSWPAQKMYWSDFCKKLEIPARGTETFTQYLKMTKSQQDDLKDVGGFVGGLVTGARKAGNIAGRDLVTLDMDNIPPNETDKIIRILESLQCGYAVYSTRKHEPIKPRLRIIIPLARTCSADEYEPIARKLAMMIGISYADPTTFQASRLMYWPSASADSEYVYRCADKPLADVDGLLGLYKDWRDVSSWAYLPGEETSRQRQVKRQGDPTEKTGIVGAFCKQYSVYEAMEKFIPGEYIPTDIDGRLTYSEGSTTGGAIIYDGGKFIYSHHATDPAGGKLCNAFDMVRLHKFADQDEDADPATPVNRMPSYKAMCDFATSIEEVTTALNSERYEKAVEVFTGTDETADVANWIGKLTVDKNGNPSKTIDNVVTIIDNDALIKGHIVFNEFKGCIEAVGSLPWNKKDERREWTDDDDAGLRLYIEKVYQITGKDRVYDGLVNAAHNNEINDVRDYLTHLPPWDGSERLDNLFIDYLGAEDNAYTRSVARKSLTAAVARIMKPGIKYDYMPILTGPQGIGKSTLFKVLGGDWYSDSIVTFEGKDAAEALQGRWIVEVAELSAMGKSRTEIMKQFISRQEDIYRKAYGRRTNKYPRQSVIFGTTNDKEFLKDSTGNRRFWPIEVTGSGSKSIFSDLAFERDQLWAEAKIRWENGEPLYLSGDIADMAAKSQEEHSEDNMKKGEIIEFILKKIPEDWDKKDKSSRRMWWSFDNSSASVRRDRICAAEIWNECFGVDSSRTNRMDAREVNGILDNIKGLERMKTNGRFGPYGIQKGFVVLDMFFLTYNNGENKVDNGENGNQKLTSAST